MQQKFKGESKHQECISYPRWQKLKPNSTLWTRTFEGRLISKPFLSTYPQLWSFNKCLRMKLIHSKSYQGQRVKRFQKRHNLSMGNIPTLMGLWISLPLRATWDSQKTISFLQLIQHMDKREMLS